ncbi:hypothetical protein lerEdw1_008134 [Lerista edwardsae]|nr:hypothetical protein lerEdw1_008134 [Lerista edwardsae]
MMAHPSGKPQGGTRQGVKGPGGKHAGPAAAPPLAPPLGESPAHSEERECQICRSAFEAERRVPKLLACLHTTCLECLKQLHLRAAARRAGGTEDHGDAITCPFCRHLTVLPDGRVQKLPVNTKLAKTLPPLGGENPPPPPPLPLY